MNSPVYVAIFRHAVEKNENLYITYKREFFKYNFNDRAELDRFTNTKFIFISKVLYFLSTVYITASFPFPEQELFSLQ